MSALYQNIPEDCKVSCGDRVERPAALPVWADNIPEQLKAQDHWVGWKYHQRNGHWTKVPISVSGRWADTTNPATWSPFDKVLAIYQSHAQGWDGVGYVFAKGGQHAGIDLDDCFLPDSQKLKPWAQQILEWFPDYAEISPSGTGLKIFTRFTLPPGTRPDWEFPDGGQVEVYDCNRYFTMTGHRWEARQ